MRSTLEMLFAIFCLSGTLLADTANSVLSPEQLASIDNFVAAEMTREQLPGLALGIYSRGRILLAKGYGLSNVELSVAVKPETLFQSGSAGKQFVSAAVMMLVEEGKLSLDDSIAKYFPNAPESWKPILVKNLLSHTSGLAEYESPERIGPKGPFYLRLDFTEDELVSKVQALPIEFKAGEKWDYRNTNYLLIGVIIHKVTGKFYADYLQQVIFKPLGMSSTRLISEADIIPNRSSGYEIRNGNLKNEEWVSPTFDSTADGTLYFNVMDLAKWDEALYGTNLLKQSSLDRMWTVYRLSDSQPNPGDYGFGWNIGNMNGHKLIGHGGAWQGFTCHIARYTDDSLTIAVLTNLDSGHSRPGLIAHVVAGLVNPALAPPKLVAISDNQPELAGSLKKLLDQIAQGKDVRSQLAPDLAGALTAEDMTEMQASLAKVWPPQTLELVLRKDLNGMIGSCYRVRNKNQAAIITYAVAQDGKVAMLDIAPNQEYR